VAQNNNAANQIP